MCDIQAVITDLDGTLLTDDKRVNKEDLHVLERLGQMGVKRIAATGRNLRISQEVLHEDFPIDYLVFSTGSGIFDWKNKKIIHAAGLSKDIAKAVIDRFIEERFDFTVHQPIPCNHKFFYHRQKVRNKHFEKYIELYAAFGEPFIRDRFDFENACQLLAIIETDVEKYEELTAFFPDVKFVRTTSPFDYKSMWIEVFPAHISKAYGLLFFEEKYNIPLSKMLGIGNDYNDIDFLNIVGYPRVVANAHPDLLGMFPVVASNENCGFAQAVKEVMPSMR